MRDVLEQLRQRAPHLDTREERTLADLDREETKNDPVRRLEARRDQLRQLATRVASSVERDATENELATVTAQLRSARRERAVQDTFDRYLPNEIDAARATRITTLAHDTLATQPAWVIDHVRHLNDNRQLTTCDVFDLATRIIQAAASLDRSGRVPTYWPRVESTTVKIPQPTVELGQ